MNKETPEQEAEIWRDVPNYEGLYEVSNIGRIKRLARNIVQANKVPRFLPEIIMKQIDFRGYRTVRIWNSGRAEQFRVHRLVGAAFIPNPHNKPYINHINGR